MEQDPQQDVPNIDARALDSGPLNKGCTMGGVHHGVVTYVCGRRTGGCEWSYKAF